MPSSLIADALLTELVDAGAIWVDASIRRPRHTAARKVVHHDGGPIAAAPLHQLVLKEGANGHQPAGQLSEAGVTGPPSLEHAKGGDVRVGLDHGHAVLRSTGALGGQCLQRLVAGRLVEGVRREDHQIGATLIQQAHTGAGRVSVVAPNGGTNAPGKGRLLQLLALVQLTITAQAEGDVPSGAALKWLLY